jgi:hypothetical protein
MIAGAFVILLSIMRLEQPWFDRMMNKSELPPGASMPCGVSMTESSTCSSDWEPHSLSSGS